MANVLIDREKASALISPEESKEIIQGVIENSTVLSRFTRLPNMASNVKEYPIMDNYPMAGFVDGDTGLKMTTDMKWSKKKIVAEEIAAILPVPDNVAADASYNIFEQVKPRLIEAAGRVIDKAILFGVDKPASWNDGLVQQAITAGNVVTESADIYKDIFGVGGLLSKIEEDGYFPNGILSAINMRAKLRNLRDKNDRPLFQENMQSQTHYTLNGMGMDFPRNGAFDATLASMIAGDFTNAVYAIRQDITFDVFNSGVISDANGKVIYNLMQNDMKAIRMVIRLGWDIFNPLNALNPDANTRFPFAVYQPAAGGASVFNMKANEAVVNTEANEAAVANKKPDEATIADKKAGK